MAWRKNTIDEKSRFRLVPWIAVAGLVLMLIGLGVVIEDLLRTQRNALHPNPASREIVLVPIDNQSLRAIGRWPWPRRYHAKMIDRLTAAGAKRIFFDITFETRSEPIDDRLLAKAIERSGRVTLPLRGATGDGTSLEQPRPLEMFSRHAKLGSIGINFNYQNAIWNLPYGAEVDGRVVPSFAAARSN